MKGLLVSVACLFVAASSAQAAPAGGPLDTGFATTPDFNGPDADLAYARAREAGATFIRIYTDWGQIAPADPSARGANPRDPENPNYRWVTLDEAINRARANKLTPIVDVMSAPKWAWGAASSTEPGAGSVKPSLAALASFTAAAAERYSGRTAGRPRVKYWQLWNEPNLSLYLRPQFQGDKLISPDWYRQMTNTFYKAVHAARADNVVIAGGTSPFGGFSEQSVSSAPLRFMRDLLCMSTGAHPRPTCAKKIQFDIWSHHPYTSGDPTHKAFSADDVSLGDLPAMKRVLDAAVKAGHVVSRQHIRFWVTEFSWDSQPGDPRGVPARMHARWVSEGLYRMWQNGVSQVTWFNLRDDPFPSGFCQCGLWLRGKGGPATDKPKLSLRAFRFPFVAFNQTNGSVSFWGRTPDSKAGAVVIEQQVGTGWARLTSARSGARGIFAGTVRGRSKSAPLRAKLVSTNDVSVPFSLKQPPDLPICAFGTC